MQLIPAIRDFEFTDAGAACVLACVQDSVEVAAFGVEVERSGDWYYRIAASCGDLRWQTGWIKLSYLGGRGVFSPTDALSKSVSLAVYFATHDFETKWRKGATSREREFRYPAAHLCAPTEEFALACARALRSWLIWELPAAAVNTAQRYVYALPPRPDGKKLKAPYSVVDTVREQIRLAVEVEKIAAGG